MTQKPAKPTKRATPAKTAKGVPADKPAQSPARAADVTPAAHDTTAKPAKRATPTKPAKVATTAQIVTAVGHATDTASKPAKRATVIEPATPVEQAAPAHTSRREPSHDEIAERAYFMALEQGDSDPAENWLRAERELANA